MPKDYVEMMQRCWDIDPSKRPTIGELFTFARNYKNLYKNESPNNETTTPTMSNSNNNSQQMQKSHPLAYHTSRILEDDIVKFKSLKISTSNDSSLNDLDIYSIISNADSNKGKL